MTNLAVLQHFFNTNWSTKWVAKPANWLDAVKMKEHEGETGEDTIIYEAVAAQSPPIDYKKWWRDYKHEWKFTCISETRQNVLDMFSEFQYMCRNSFYPAPWFPTWNSDEDHVLCHLDCNEGTGTTVYDSTDNNFDFELDGDNPPTWITTGGIHEKNYLKFDQNDLMSEDGTGDGDGTFLDTFPANITVQVVGKIDATATRAVTQNWFSKINDSTVATQDQLVVQGNDPTEGGKVRVLSYDAGNVHAYIGGYVPTDRWTSICFTAGTRGVELYVNGVLTYHSTTAWTKPGTDTEENAKIFNASANNHFHIQRLSISSVQRFPYDHLYLPEAAPKVEKQTNLYIAEVKVVGELSNIFLGGNV